MARMNHDRVGTVFWQGIAYQQNLKHGCRSTAVFVHGHSQLNPLRANSAAVQSVHMKKSKQISTYKYLDILAYTTFSKFSGICFLCIFEQPTSTTPERDRKKCVPLWIGTKFLSITCFHRHQCNEAGICWANITAFHAKKKRT